MAFRIRWGGEARVQYNILLLHVIIIIYRSTYNDEELFIRLKTILFYVTKTILKYLDWVPTAFRTHIWINTYNIIINHIIISRLKIFLKFNRLSS